MPFVECRPYRLAGVPLHSLSFNAGTAENRSATRPTSATWKIGASSSLIDHLLDGDEDLHSTNAFQKSGTLRAGLKMPALELPLHTAKKFVAHAVQSGGACSALNPLLAPHYEAWP